MYAPQRDNSNPAVPTMTDNSDDIEPTTLARLGRGETLITAEPVPGQAIPRVLLRAVIDCPPKQVWPLIDRCGDYQRTMPNIKASQELSREEGRVRVRVTVGMPFPLPNLTSITESLHTAEPGERYVRKWELVEGDYKSNSGSWTLTPFQGDPARTLLEYRVHAVPKIPVPKKLQQLAQKKALPKLVEQLRRLARG
jgi:ribosome-associated toxin RatA of RatAB toxin-antitoxin module